VLQRLDNEVSKVLIQAIKDKGIDFQLASPNDHRLNPVERAIQTFQNHLIAILHGCDRKFPAWLGCQIIPQVVMTINMLRRSRINPRLSAHTQIFGIFDYNRTPLAPIGTKTVVVFLPEKYTMPTTASADRASTAFEQLTETLKNPAAAKPFLNTVNK
jgi:hypothetical protein